jgi:hypothetical protein
MAFYPVNALLNTVYEQENLAQTIVYITDTTPTYGATGVGVSTGGQAYPVTVVASTPNATITVLNNYISGYYTNVFNNEISYRTKDNQFVTTNSWTNVTNAIANDTFSDLYHFKADPRPIVTYSYVASANLATRTYTIDVQNDWMTGRNKLIKYTNFTRYQQEILVRWINNNSDRVTWFNKVFETIDWENYVLGATGI